MRYEDHPVNWKPEASGWFDEVDVRQGAYWSILAGGFGHTYGCHNIWQMYAPGRRPMGHARRSWKDSLDLPGAFDMMHVRRLMESRPALLRVPDQSLIVSGQGTGGAHVRAARASDGSYAFVYIPTGRPVGVDLSRLSGAEAKAWWFDPRTGDAHLAGEFPTGRAQEFVPPGGERRGNDWVLVLDDASRGFAPPGKAR